MRRMTTSSQVSTQVPVGPSSILGWLAAAAAFVTSTVQSLEHSQALVSGPGKWPAILGVVALAATNAGRQFQAAHLGKAAVIAGDLGGVLPTLAQEIDDPSPVAPMARPETAAVPDGGAAETAAVSAAPVPVA